MDSHTAKSQQATYTVIDYESINSALCTDFDFELLRTLTPADGIQMLTRKLSEYVSNYSTSRKVFNKKSKIQPWLNDQKFGSLTRHKQTLWSKAKRRPGNTALKKKINDVTLQLKQLKLSLKKNYFLRKFNCRQSCKVKWDEINRIVGRSKAVSVVQRLIKSDQSQPITNHNEIGNEFNIYFSTIGQTLQQQVPRRRTPIQSTERRTKTMFVTPTNYSEIKNIISKLDENKSVGLDGITNKMLKRCIQPISAILSIILNKIIDYQDYPDNLKTARVVPIHKSGNQDNCENYRPISILTGINRIFETALNERIISFMKHTKFLTAHQYGFRRKSHTSIAVTEALSYVYKNLDDPRIKVVTGLFLDLSKAFDVVHHETLLRKLYNAGFRGVIFNILQSYLTNRSQCVKIGETISDQQPVVTGVPQGSVLGPTLFLIFMNDLTTLNLHGKVYLFADDTTLFYPGQNSHETCAKIKEDLLVLEDYYCSNLLILNKTKTKYIHFHHKRQMIDLNPTIEIRGERVERTNKIPFLGVILDENLDWSEQCKAINKKISSGIGAIFQTRKYLPREVLVQMYHSFIHVHLCYMVSVWGSAKDVHLKSTQVLQNRALKLVSNLPRLTSTYDVYQNHSKGILPIKGLHQLYVLKHVKQTMNNESYGTIGYRFKSGVTRLRDDFKLEKKTPRTDFGKQHIEYKASTFFNALPLSVRTLSSTRVFMKTLKNLLISADHLPNLLFH